MVTALILVPSQFRSEAVSKGEGLFTRTSSDDPALPNYDIRLEKSKDAADYFAAARQSTGKDAVSVANVRDGFVRGENALRSQHPNVKFEYNEDIRIPEVITPDVWKQSLDLLSSPSTAKRAEILRNFVRENDELTGMTGAQTNALKVAADYTNPDGNLSYAHLEQRINDIPVFRGEVKAGFTKSGQIIRVINNLAPGLDYESLSTDFRNPVDAVRAAARYINYEPQATDVTVNPGESNELRTVFGGGDWATTAEKMYFPTEPGIAVPSWRVTIWRPVNAYMIIVDAQTGTLLWRKNATSDQAQSATYQIYRNSNSFLGAHDSPAPLSPGPTGPITTQGALLTRSNVTLIGNEAPYAFNNLGWITDGANGTDGNNLEAGIDRDGTNGVDATQTGAPNRVFDSTWNPPPGSPAPGDEPLTAQAQRGAVIQMFYVMNRYHDELYRVGFTEPARNFQNDNFGRGGVGNDRISAEGQDSSGTNNANFSIVADGTRGRMQMYLWSGPTPDYDGTTDAEVIIHEVTHGTSNRLHGNSTGLTANMSGGMGEGWGDWYAYTMLAEPTDAINGIYTTGGYATFSLGGMMSNYYHGIRRFPRAPITFTGGPNNMPHNPFTFKHLNGNCDTTLGTTAMAVSSAFPRNPSVSTSSGVQACNQVHNGGEVWSSMLWEVRNRMVSRLGFAAGTTRVLQVVTDGMKLAPLNPTFLQERDAIIAAAAALPIAPEASADVGDVREGFRVRGMGFSASIQNANTGGTANATQVTEAFDVPNALISNPITVSDSTGDNDSFPEPGELLSVSVPISNNSGGGTINTVSASITGGGTADYGNIADGATVTRQISYTVPAGAICGSLHTITITGTSALGALNPRMFTFRLGQPTFGGSTQNFDSVTAPALPAGFENVLLSGTAINWVTSATGPNSAPNSAFANDPASLNDAALQTTAKITSATASISFKNKWTTESTFDGMVLEYSTDGGATWVDVCPSCATICPGASCPFVSGGYTQTISTGFSSPIGGRRAWAGTQATYIDTVVNLPAALNGQTIGLRWRMASDVSVASTGVNVDDIVLTGGQFLDTYVCSLAGTRSRADFDGDGKTDVSVFRAGTWYANRSTAGFLGLSWGVGSDTIVPADYDSDGKTDTAVFRPNPDPTQPDFYILNSAGFTVTGISWGTTGDIPVVADYDGDGKSDVAVYRPSSNVWFVLNSGGGISVDVFGQAGDVPVAGNFAGSNLADRTLYRSSTNSWVTQVSGGGVLNYVHGTAGDVLVPADYDNDNIDDRAVYRPSTGQWFVLKSTDGTVSITHFGGVAGDIPVPGDYDGDGRDDVAIYRNGAWWQNRSTGGVTVQFFGSAADVPVLKGYIP